VRRMDARMSLDQSLQREKARRDQEIRNQECALAACTTTEGDSVQKVDETRFKSLVAFTRVIGGVGTASEDML